MYLDDDRRPTLTPQLAVRVALIGGIALVAFAVIFFRLWYLQVLSGRPLPGGGATTTACARSRSRRRAARSWTATAASWWTTGPSMAVVLSPDRLPEDVAERQALYRRLGKLLDDAAAGDRGARWSRS